MKAIKSYREYSVMGMDGQTDGRMDRQMDRSTDGWTDAISMSPAGQDGRK